MKNITIMYDTSMKDFPLTCADCPVLACKLPENQKTGELLKLFISRRHPDCPLKKVKPIDRGLHNGKG